MPPSRQPFPPPAPRPRRSRRGYVIRGVALLGVLGAGLLLVRFGRTWFFPAPPAVVRPIGPPEPPARDPAELVESLKQAIRSVAVIEAVGPSGRRPIGAGLVLDREGHVLTCLHVVVQTANGAVRFRSGAAYDIEGCTAVDPGRDLAIVKLKETPPEVTPYRAATEPKPDRAVYAVGHPSEDRQFTIESGRLLQNFRTDQLPEESRRFLSGLTPGGETLRWLRHTASLDDGFSGGPLHAADGSVLGLNVWVDDAGGFGYALDQRDIEAFLAQSRQPPIPLSRLALPEVRARAERWQLSAARLQKVFDHARALQWHPANYEDYQILRQLAAGMTLARQPDLLAADGVVEKQVEALAKAADKAAGELRRKKWRDAGQLTLINEFASQALTEPLGGLFAFAQVVEIRDKDTKQAVAVFRLAGFEEEFLVPLRDQLQAPDVGGSFLLLGLIQPPVVNEPRADRLPVVVCHTFISLEKP